ncbi:hypothetical protein Pfo_026863 [Paulownia fortunei]|nr:hypothetical protein Pfo_026863 [Paulownia fortunei]
MSNELEKDSEETNAASTFTCEICLEPALSSQKFQHKNNCCVHEFCIKCIASHIQAKVEENIATINCLELSCEQTLDPVECQPMIPPEIFIKWCDCLCNSAISGLKKCYCPYQRCSELVLNECDETVKRCSCPRCKRLFCYTCRVPWHAGYWCSESHLKRDLNETQFGFLLEQMKWTRCPGCGQPVERISGCRYVICRCGRSFCYNCGGSPHLLPCEFAKGGQRGICDALFLYAAILGLVYMFFRMLYCLNGC